MDVKQQYGVLIVCMGNICRSPTAHGLLEKHLVQHTLDEVVYVDSAGTHSYHLGCPPDKRSIAAVETLGVDISGQRSRKISIDDFERFDEILVMDQANLSTVEALQPAKTKARIQLIMGDLPSYGLTEVPDPYYGSGAGFVQVVDMLEQVCDAICNRIKQQLKL